MKKFYIPVVFLISFLVISGSKSLLRAAEIIYVEGNVQVQPDGEEEWSKAEKGMQLNMGDSIRTARHSKADVALDREKKNTIRIDPKTMIVLNSSMPGSIDRLDLSRGKVYSNLENIKAGLDFEVSTPSTVAGVRGSSYSVYSERDEDEVQAYKDNVYIKTFDENKNLLSESTLPEGFKTFIERFDTPSAITQVTNREFSRSDAVMEDLSSRAEGRANVRAEREAAKAREEKAKEEAKTKEEKAQDIQNTVSEQQEVADIISDTKEIVEEQITEKKLQDLGEEESGGS
ncbi:MAG: FecR family protein [Candidatus Omnitrophota bacterium]